MQIAIPWPSKTDKKRGFFFKLRSEVRPFPWQKNDGIIKHDILNKWRLPLLQIICINIRTLTLSLRWVYWNIYQFHSLDIKTGERSEPKKWNAHTKIPLMMPYNLEMWFSWDDSRRGAQPPPPPDPTPPPPPSTSAPGCPHRYPVVSSTVTETMSFVPYAPDQMFCPVCLSTGIGRLNGKKLVNFCHSNGRFLWSLCVFVCILTTWTFVMTFERR